MQTYGGLWRPMCLCECTAPTHGQPTCEASQLGHLLVVLLLVQLTLTDAVSQVRRDGCSGRCP